MNPVKSFTLCPSSAFSALDDGSKENHHSVIPGTIRQDFGRPRPIVNPEAGLGIRASPFEPLIQDRNLPKSGTISPFKSEEYEAWMRSRGDMHSRSPHNPFAEPCYRVSGNGNNESSWKLRYLQSEMSRTQMRMNMLALMEEKRQMRIKMLGLEAALQLERSENAESKNSRQSPESAAENNPSISCDVSNENEKLKYVNMARGGRASKSLDRSESLQDEIELDDISERLSSCLNTTTSTVDNNDLEKAFIDEGENENANRSVNQAINKSTIEANAFGVIDTLQMNPPESHEPPPSVMMTRSHHHRKDAEHKLYDASPEKLETLAEKENVARVSLDHVDFTTIKSEDDSSKIDAKMERNQAEAALPNYSIGVQSETNTSSTEKQKRKRNMMGNLFSSIQAPPGTKQTRRGIKAKR